METTYETLKCHRNRLVKRFMETGSAAKRKADQAPSVLTGDRVDDIRQRMNVSPYKPVRKLALQTDGLVMDKGSSGTLGRRGLKGALGPAGMRRQRSLEWRQDRAYSSSEEDIPQRPVDSHVFASLLAQAQQEYSSLLLTRDSCKPLAVGKRCAKGRRGAGGNSGHAEILARISIHSQLDVMECRFTNTLQPTQRRE
ncbi:hypothetical protein Trydic_g21162 [Trypoxylus dichotomus]